MAPIRIVGSVNLSSIRRGEFEKLKEQILVANIIIVALRTVELLIIASSRIAIELNGQLIAKERRSGSGALTDHFPL